MTSRRDKRKKAYQFVYDKLHESGHRISHNADQAIDVANVISLAELYKLKSGDTDPSSEFVIGLKALLRHVASESEIEEYLVKPFLSKSHSSK